MTRRKPVSRNSYPLISWRPDRRATRAHIQEAIRKADADIALCLELVSNKDAWDHQCGLMQNRAWGIVTRTLKDVARQNLEYWRMRAFMPGAYGVPNTGDRPAFAKWQEFAK
jgi:hypothetical protein